MPPWVLVLVLAVASSAQGVQPSNFALQSTHTWRMNHTFMPGALPCPVINKPKDQPSWIPSTSFAASAAAIATQYSKGALLVIGANEGKSDNDPSFQVFSSKNAAHMLKIFVEPIPWLFAQLQNNVKNMTHARAIQAAVADRSGTMEMFCFAFDPKLGPPAVWPAELRMKARTNSAKRDGRGWWTQICSLTRDRLFHQMDMGREFANAREVLAPYIKAEKVKVVTVDELLQNIGKQHPVRHVQIDVEGFDDIVLKALPLGLERNGLIFRPASITFEHVVLDNTRVETACMWLNEKGYSTCREGQNIVAIALPH